LSWAISPAFGLTRWAERTGPGQFASTGASRWHHAKEAQRLAPRELLAIGALVTTMAYLDAGTGSMMLQAVLGGVAGLAVMGRLLRARLARILFFWRRPVVVAEPLTADTTEQSGSTHASA
jgi:hypothetical protein